MLPCPCCGSAWKVDTLFLGCGFLFIYLFFYVLLLNKLVFVQPLHINKPVNQCKTKYYIKISLCESIRTGTASGYCRLRWMNVWVNDRCLLMTPLSPWLGISTSWRKNYGYKCTILFNFIYIASIYVASQKTIVTISDPRVLGNGRILSMDRKTLNI